MTKEIIFLSQPADVSMADEWFGIASTDHFWMEWRFRFIRRSLERAGLLKRNGRYLEIGCGHGQFLKQCDEHLPDIAVDGCDLNLYALKKIENARGDVFVYNIFEMPESMHLKYEGIFLLDVIEHIDDDAAFLRKALEHAKPGGIVVINVPALSALFSKYDTVAGHKRRYTRKRLVSLFEQCGLEPVYISYWGFSLLPIALLRKIYLLFVPERKVIAKGFRPGFPWVNSLLKLLMRVELALVRSPILGTSVVAVGKLIAKPK